MTKKKTVAFTVDSEKWELLKVLLPCSRSKFLDNAITNYINSNNELDDLLKEKEELESKLTVINQKIEHLQAIKEKNSKDKDKLNNAIKTAIKIHDNHNNISIEQIKNISDINFIDYNVLIRELEKEDITISKYTSENSKIL